MIRRYFWSTVVLIAIFCPAVQAQVNESVNCTNGAAHNATDDPTNRQALKETLSAMENQGKMEPVPSCRAGVWFSRSPVM